MTRPFFARLSEYFTNVGKVLQGEASASSIFPNTTDIGITKELVYADVLQAHLPASCKVVLGGFLFGRDGSESKQIDILVTNDMALQFTFHNRQGKGKSFSCVDGCIGVVSVKSRLDTRELEDSLMNLASIPQQQTTDGRVMPFARIKNYENWPFRVVFASDGMSGEALLEALNQFYVRNPSISPHRRPDLIHVTGKYVIVRMGSEGGVTRDGSVIAPNQFYLMHFSCDVFGLFYAVIKMQEIAMASRALIFNYSSMINDLPI